MVQDYRKYDVVMVDFGNNNEGSEINGNHPALIIQNDKGNLFGSTTIVMPFTSQIHKNPNQPTHYVIKKNVSKGLIKDSMLQAECMRQVSENRILKHLGHISDEVDRLAIKRCYIASFGD